MEIDHVMMNLIHHVRKFGKHKLKEFESLMLAKDCDTCVGHHWKNIWYPPTLEVFTKLLYKVFHNNHNGFPIVYIVNYFSSIFYFTLTLSIIVQREIAIIIQEAICTYNEKHSLESQSGKGVWVAMHVVDQKTIGPFKRSELKKLLDVNNPKNIVKFF